MTPLVTFVVLSFVVARLTRFVTRDTLWEGTREKLLTWLKDPVVSVDDAPGADSYGDVVVRNKRVQLIRDKLAELIDCAYCTSIWMSAATLFAYRIFVDPVPAPVAWWLGLSMTAIAIIEYTDGVREVRVTEFHQGHRH